MKVRESLSALSGPAVYWLMAIALASLLAVLGLKLVFDDLQDELRNKSANERARLFIGEEIVHGIADTEKYLYQMHTATNEAGVKRIARGVEAKLAKLRHDLAVLRDGGSVRREIFLNIEGRDEMVSEVVYQPDSQETGYVMELIEIGPLLDEVDKKSRELEVLQISGRGYQANDEQGRFYAWHQELDVFLKHIPPYFDRLNENANRLFFDSSDRLKRVEAELAIHRTHLKRLEFGLIVLVLVSAGVFGTVFVRRIDATNRQLEAALEEMRAAKDAAERASRAKSEFVSRMSHELRTPLNAIIGFADLLEAEPLSPSHKSYVNLINSSGKHLLELINAVLDHAKIESGKLTLESINFDFRETIAAVGAIVSARASAKGLSYIASIDPQLPRFIIGDPTRLRQILLNLLGNAIKFTAHGSVELRIGADDGYLIFSVRDTGIGMDAAAQARLFQPFSQADDSVTRKYGGTGLGLQISKELIDAMGGHVEVESAPGAGTVFWVTLPLRRAEAAAAAVAPAMDSAPAVAAWTGSRALLVDDNRVNRELGGAMLERLGLTFDTAENGAEALRRLASAEYAFVLMDMEMPVMDGVTATRALRAEEVRLGRRRLPVIAMTANALQADRERCFAAGMDGFIAKPIIVDNLRNELHRLFGGAAADSRPAEVVTESPAETLFDRAAAIDMLGDESLFEEVAAMFVVDAKNYLAEMDEALAAADDPRLARVAHTLKGLCSTFVAKRGESAARALEQAARAGDRAACTDLAVQVRGQVEALSAALAGK